MTGFWFTNGKLLTPMGIVEGAVQVARGRIAAIRARAPRGARAINLRGAYLAPGFIDLHVWGEPKALSLEMARHGTTAFLTTLAPAPEERMVRWLHELGKLTRLPGAECVGIHLEGPFLNPLRGGALPRRWMRRPSIQELRRLTEAAGGRLRMITLAPELPGAMRAIRWCRQYHMVVSLGHSDADVAAARQAVAAGARAVTHVFNGMRAFHHRRPSLVDAALTEPRLTTMVIADGAHVSLEALRLLFRAKGAEGIALVTDSVRSQARAWGLHRHSGAYYTSRKILAGSCLTMMEAVRHAAQWGGASLCDAVRMATETPARLLGLEGWMGSFSVGHRADLVAFDRAFRVRMTIVGGRLVYQRG